MLRYFPIIWWEKRLYEHLYSWQYCRNRNQIDMLATPLYKTLNLPCVAFRGLLAGDSFHQWRQCTGGCECIVAKPSCWCASLQPQWPRPERREWRCTAPRSELNEHAEPWCASGSWRCWCRLWPRFASAWHRGQCNSQSDPHQHCNFKVKRANALSLVTFKAVIE